MLTDVSIIITGHREGLLAVPGIRSAALARALAEQAGIAVETIYVLDQPDHDTIEQFRSSADADTKILEIQIGDPGLARNAGVAAAAGKWIAFLDADDLWAESWIRDAVTCAQNFSKEAVWHPESSILFGEETNLFPHPDMEDNCFDLAGLAVDNYWTALCFAPRKVLLEIPYRATDFSMGVGYEDWNWNVDIIAHGLLHKVVPGTVHAIRIKPAGRNSSAYSANALPEFFFFFRDILLSRTDVTRLQSK